MANTSWNGEQLTPILTGRPSSKPSVRHASSALLRTSAKRVNKLCPPSSAVRKIFRAGAADHLSRNGDNNDKPHSHVPRDLSRPGVCRKKNRPLVFCRSSCVAGLATSSLTCREPKKVQGNSMSATAADHFSRTIFTFFEFKVTLTPLCLGFLLSKEMLRAQPQFSNLQSYQSGSVSALLSLGTLITDTGQRPFRSMHALLQHSGNE